MRGLIIGKFYPPHRGHHLLINAALKSAETLDVLIVDNPRDGISATRRMEWLSQLHPTAQFHIIDDINDEDNSEAWAKHTLNFLEHRPDVVFSSESYGSAYAKLMGAEHQMVDQKRQKVTVSATEIRSDLIKHWDYLDARVKQALALRVVVLGAESTGTTTLASELARKYKTIWVPEVGRSYAEGVAHRKSSWADDDFKAIARLQQDYENKLAAHSDGLIFCDTNATATVIWQWRYMKRSTKAVQQIAQSDKVDLYIITGPEIPFVQDGTRDGEYLRQQMHQKFVDSLNDDPAPVIIATGSIEERLKQVTPHIDKMVVRKKIIKDLV